MKKRLFLFYLFSALGCASVSFETGRPADTSLSYDEYFDSWFFGALSGGWAEATRSCPSGEIAKIRSYYSLEDLMLGGLSAFIYLPRTVTLTCATEKAQNVSSRL